MCYCTYSIRIYDNYIYNIYNFCIRTYNNACRFFLFEIPGINLPSAPRLQVPKGFEQEGASLIKKGGPTIKVC